MKFFFPDSQDQIDPTFDFVTEERSHLRVRQRDELYAHEALSGTPFNGFLVSKAIVDGVAGATGKYTLAQRHRLYRVGVRNFFRLDNVPGPTLETLGDCGAFNYVKEEFPLYTPDQVIDFYEECGFDLGISVDHVILGYNPAVDDDTSHEKSGEWRKRQQITLELAAQFLSRCHERRVRFQPLGVAQGWSPRSYAAAVRELQKIGYKRVALGGMVPLKTHEILACLREIERERDPQTQLHLLGVTRYSNIPEFANFGVTSFDSTSAFRQSFKDDRDNYHWLDRNYTAIRVPQVDGNPKLKARIKAGRVEQSKAFELEQACLRALRGFDAGETTIEKALDTLGRYEEIFDGRKDYSLVYRETLSEAPWKRCGCGICGRVGINVVLFRGSERNKRRGFHNLYVLRQQLDRELGKGSAG
jgi:hypothetical protein